jgi:diguanylate cyclase (GGDEF)-like protein
MQSSEVRALLKRLGLTKSSILLTAIAVGVSVAITLLLMVATRSFSALGLVIAVVASLSIATLMSVVFLRILFQLEEAENELRKLAVTDELTGVYNRRYFLEVAGHEIARCLRFGKPFSCILLDIDGFKRTNDSYGHGTGDEVLKSVASLCQRHCRKIDTFARYGGDEFYFLLPECTQEEAQVFAERIRQAVEQVRVEYAGTKVLVTASLGVQAFGGAHDSLDRLLIRTDSAMYSAKQSGKNRVSVEAVLNNEATENT